MLVLRAWLLVALSLLAVTLMVPAPAGAEQYVWTTTGTYATHEIPEAYVPIGATFMISGSLRGTGTTDDVELGPLDVEGCTVLEQQTHEPAEVVIGWHARLRMDSVSCSWVRVGNYTDDAIGGTEPVTVVVAAGSVMAYEMHEFGQDPAQGVWGQWFLPVLFFGASIAFWLGRAEFPGVVSFLGGLGLLVPGTEFGNRSYILLLMALAIVLHHYWGGMRRFYEKRKRRDA